jgi:serine/threonine protein kinase
MGPARDPSGVNVNEGGSAAQGGAASASSVIAALRGGIVLDGRFRLVEAIGRGGFGEVFRAEELLPNGAAIREVALKILSPESDLGAWAEEAKLLASFSHPSLVTILAAGLLTVETETEAEGARVPVPFVAMELLDGETLGAVLARRGRIPWRRVLAWARDVAAALDLIHARGVVHLDLKPSNLFLTREGGIKVLDFGIARRAGALSGELGARLDDDDAAMGTAEFLAERKPSPSLPPPLPSQGGSVSSGARARVVGTPGFMAPEVIEERPATPAADAYALAACIVHLATGVLPQDVPAAPAKTAPSTARQAWWAEVRLATSAGRLRDLDEAGLPHGIAALCRRLLALDPGARLVEPGSLRALLDAAWERPYGVPDPPYLGLGAFGPASEGMLFGRDEDTARLARELETETALVLQGVSGSGKSSLAMAGLVPQLARRDAARGLEWRCVVVRPGADPDAALARALDEIAGFASPGAEVPVAAPEDAAAVAAFCAAHSIGVAFVFDQLEELVTQADLTRRARFIDFLAEAAALPREANVRVVGTLREDFTSGLLAIEPLGERLRDALRFVGAPTMAASRAIVAEPARVAGVRIEGLGEVAGDVERELRAGEGRLPLVALALAAWWKTKDGDTLRAADWARLGGVRAIFAELADGVFATLDEAAQHEARATLLELSTDGRTRRSLPRSYLRERARSEAGFDRATAAFIEKGLLVEAGGAIEVVHEFLFTAWDRLAGWLADAQASRRIAAALREGARTWQDLGRPVTRLPGDSEAALASLVLAEGGLDAEGAELVRAWIAAQRARLRVDRLRGAGLALAVLAALLVGLAAWGKTVSDAQERAELSKHEAEVAGAKARDNEISAVIAQERAEMAQERADKSSAERQRVGDMARRQQEEFERLLHNAESETKKAKIRCSVIEKRDRIQAGGCPPGDPLCSSTDPGGALPAGLGPLPNETRK